LALFVNALRLFGSLESFVVRGRHGRARAVIGQCLGRSVGVDLGRRLGFGVGGMSVWERLALMRAWVVILMEMVRGRKVLVNGFDKCMSSVLAFQSVVVEFIEV